MMKTTSRARSGFFFAVMALAMLSLVLMTVQVWVKTFEQTDYRASQRFKGEAVRSILTSLSDQTLSGFANASAFYATYKLANYTSDSNNRGIAPQEGIPVDSNNLGTFLVKKTAIELMINGSSEPNSGKKIEYSDEEKGSYTLAGWQNKTDAAANAMGFDIQFSDARNFKYYQIDPWTVGVSFDLEMNITDIEGSMRQNKTMHAESNFSISGFLDPMISRNDMVHRTVPRDKATDKQIFKLDAYNVPEDVKPTKMKDSTSSGDGTGSEGNGWFFGPITEQTLEGIIPQGTPIDLKQYVLVTRYNDSLAGIADLYGAVLLTEEPLLERTVENGCNVTTQTRCLNCMRKVEPSLLCESRGWEPFPDNNAVNVPVIAVNNWNTNSVTPVIRAQPGGDITERFVLIDNEKDSRNEKMIGYHRVWDITLLRDMAICGFYVKGKGPSFFQRMLQGAETIQNPYFGIESFVVGQWAGGAEDKGGNYAADSYSRLDWEFYSGLTNDVTKIKGMMGCKSREMCTGPGYSSNATLIGVGRFRLSDDAVSRYWSTLISCKNTPAALCD